MAENHEFSFVHAKFERPLCSVIHMWSLELPRMVRSGEADSGLYVRP